MQEWIVGWLGIRADTLVDTIWGMLDDPKKRAGPWGRFGEQIQKFFERHSWFQNSERFVPLPLPGLVKELYAHPLISELAQSNRFPSYIPSDTFAQALFETVMIAGPDESVLQAALKRFEMALSDFVEASAQAAVSKSLVDLTQLAQDVAQKKGRLADLHQAVDAFKTQYHQYAPHFNAAVQAELPKDPNKLLDQLEASAVNLMVTNPDLTRVLDGMIKGARTQNKKAEDALILARTSAESWFNNSMDRATGWYKRNRQMGAFIIAFILALLLNVDSVAIGIDLWRDPVLRKAVETAAVEQAKKDSPPTEVELQESMLALRIPFGWHFDPIKSFDPKEHHCTLLPNEDAQDTEGAKEGMLGIAFNGQCRLWTNAPRGWGWPAKLAGIAITALAGMQGAPFWFDMLQELVNLRAAGKKPEDNPEKKGE